MKQLMLISVVIMLGLFLGVTAQAGPVVNPGTYCTNEETFVPDWYASCNEGLFFTKFWKEKFWGGGPGKPGNVLMAIGEGFVFQNAVLKNVVGPVVRPWCTALGGVARYMTTYEGGMLTLNSSGPWLKKGSLKAENVTAYNYSCHDANGSLLSFKLFMYPEFDKTDYSFEIAAFFDVGSENYEVKVDDDGVVFQRGYDFDALIDIEGP
jgi:hypothetical protein